MARFRFRFHPFLAVCTVYVLFLASVHRRIHIDIMIVFIGPKNTQLRKYYVNDRLIIYYVLHVNADKS